MEFIKASQFENEVTDVCNTMDKENSSSANNSQDFAIANSNFDIRMEISKIFVGGFKSWLTIFSKDEEKLAKAMSHIFIMDNFYLATMNTFDSNVNINDEGKPTHIKDSCEELVGIASCISKNEKSVKIQWNELRRHLGFFKGSIASIVLKREIEKHDYPFPMESNWGSIELVATAEKYRGNGVAFGLISHIIENTDFESYILEVADTNESAVKLYSKLGFNVFDSVEQKYKKQSGFNYYLYMKYDRKKSRKDG